MQNSKGTEPVFWPPTLEEVRKKRFGEVQIESFPEPVTNSSAVPPLIKNQTEFSNNTNRGLKIHLFKQEQPKQGKLDFQT